MSVDPVSGAITGVVALLVAIIGALSQWSTYRRSLVDTSQEVAQDHALIKFWEEWLRVRLTCASPQEAATLNKRAAEALDGLRTCDEHDARRVAQVVPNGVQRALLFYPSNDEGFLRRYLVIPLTRFLFYALATATAYYATLAIIILARGLKPPSGYEPVSDDVLGMVVIAIFGTFMTLAVHALAFWINPPRRAGSNAANG
jgi:hypothetical protein